LNLKTELNLLSQILELKIEKHLVTKFWFRILKEPKYMPFSAASLIRRT